jgi:hypothetical protein
MNTKNLFSAVPSYIIGLSVGLFLIVAAAWADMESTFYGFGRLASAGLRGLSCPILMTRDETRTISLDVSNTTDSPISPAIKTEISTALVPQEFLESIKLAPRESKRLEWSVGPENIDLERFIFAKVLFFSAYPLPNREATCGIFIVDLPGSGRVLVPILVALSLLGMGWGLYAMRQSADSNGWVAKYFGSMAFLAFMVVLGLVVSFIGDWVPSVLVLAVAVIMLFLLLGSFFTSVRGR